MRLTPAHLWSLSLGVFAVLWCALPVCRLPTGILIGLHAAVLSWGVSSIRSGFFGRVFCKGSPRSNAVALTFDDGPDAELTPAVLDLLSEFKATATFFVVARKAAAHSAIVKRMVAEGHSVQCHDLDHSPWSNFRLFGRMRSEIAEARAIIGDITGTPPSWYRPPAGMMNPHVLPALTSLTMRCAGWSRRAVDFGNRSTAALRRIPSLAGPGEVIMLHDSAPDTARRELFLQSLRLLLQDLQTRGLRCVTVDGMAAIIG